MKILVYGINFFPEVTGVGRYTAEMAAWLAKAGHEIRVVTAPPHFPDWSIAPGYSGSAYCREQWGGVGIWRTPIRMPRGGGGVRRLLAVSSFAASSLPVLLRQIAWRPDVVWMAEPALVCAPGGVLTAFFSRARSWLHVQDFEVDAAFDLGLLGGTVQRGLASWLERYLLRRFDRVSTISPKMAEKLRCKGIPEERIVYFPNWVDTAEIRPMPHSSPYRRELGLAEEDVVVLYSGSIGAKQGIEMLGDAARALAHEPSVQFVFCGQGVGRRDLEARCLGLANVRFLPLQPPERLNELLNLADIHVLPQRRDATDLVLPSKLLGMLASGRPVIAAAEPDSTLGGIVERCGLVVPPENPERMADAILRLAHAASLRRELGQVGRRYVEQHMERDAVIARFEEELCALAGRPRSVVLQH